jgi:hypothetical protein
VAKSGLRTRLCRPELCAPDLLFVGQNRHDDSSVQRLSIARLDLWRYNSPK